MWIFDNQLERDIELLAKYGLIPRPSRRETALRWLLGIAVFASLPLLIIALPFIGRLIRAAIE